MITQYKSLALVAFTSAVLSGSAAAALVPNGDFANPAGDAWEEVSDGGTYAYDYPSSGGNPDGHGIINNSDGGGGFGIWVANAGGVLTLDSLGLTAGESYVFSQDMRVVSGENIGGFKVDFFTGTDGAGSTGELYPSMIGDGSSWETYRFVVTIPAAADGIKVVPLWAPDSSIAYDNIGYDPTPIVAPLIPNGDFENGPAGWLEIGGETAWEYPGSGGNPNGYGVMTNAGGGFGIWVANGGAPLALESLGLSAGEVVTFLQDMTILSGDSIGGLKIEFLAGADFLSDTGDMRPTLIGDGSTWETYAFEVTIPPTTDHIKVVPLWGSGSSVGYDNLRFTKASGSAPRFSADIQLATVLTWEPEDPAHLYQPQESFDGFEWDNLGSRFSGSNVTSIVTPYLAPFYRIEEFEIISADAALNSGFELEDPSDPTCAESWVCFSSSAQPPTRVTTDARSGDASMRIAVLNDASGIPNTSEIQQNINAGGGLIIPGESYEFSFWAKQISSGVSYVQNYRLQWLDDSDAILSGGVGFNGFAGGNGDWVQITASNLVAPAGTAKAFIQIFGATGAIEGDSAFGEVLIDDLMLATTTISSYDTIDAIVGDGVQITWETQAGKSYQVESSLTDLNAFENFGAEITGDGGSAAAGDLLVPGGKYYRVVETATP